MPKQEFEEFERHMEAARQSAGTAVALQAQVTGALSVDDLLRGALVQGVSAFDRYIHEEVRSRMLELFDSEAPPVAMARFQVPISSVIRFKEEGGAAWLDEVIRSRHAILSFQQPDKVADAIRLICDGELWNSVGLTTGRSPQDIKRQLKLIITRRNAIAHESDMSPVPPYERAAIEAGDVDSSLTFLCEVATAIRDFVEQQVGTL